MKNWIIATMIIITLFASGCTQGNNNYPITDKDYKTGTQGLVFDFIPNGPPATVFEDSNFDIATDLWNKGAYPINNLFLTATVENDYMCILKQGTNDCASLSTEDQKLISDITEQKSKRTELLVEKDQINQEAKANPETKAADAQKVADIDKQVADISTKIDALDKQFKVINTDITKTISGMQGRSVYYPDGTSSHVEFTAKAKKLDLLSVQHTSPVVLTACYDYYTELSQDICIDPDITSTAKKACKAADITLTDQGAPIAITKIETRVMPDGDNVKLDFLIYIKNKGDGQVVNKDMLKEACSAAKLSRNDWNRVTLTEFGFSSQDYFYKFGATDNKITCSPNPLRLTSGPEGGVDFIRCSIDNAKLTADQLIKKSTPSFLTQAYIRLDYGYTKSITKDVVIKSTNS